MSTPWPAAATEKLGVTGNPLEAAGHAVRVEEMDHRLPRQGGAQWSINERGARQRAAVDDRLERDHQPPRAGATGDADSSGPVRGALPAAERWGPGRSPSYSHFSEQLSAAAAQSSSQVIGSS